MSCANRMCDEENNLKQCYIQFSYPDFYTNVSVYDFIKGTILTSGFILFSLFWPLKSTKGTCTFINHSQKKNFFLLSYKEKKQKWLIIDVVAWQHFCSNPWEKTENERCSSFVLTMMDKCARSLNCWPVCTGGAVSMLVVSS